MKAKITILYLCQQDKMCLKHDPDTTSQKADTIILECTTGDRQNNTNSTR